MRTKAFSHTDFLLSSPTDASDRPPHSLGRGLGLPKMHLRIHNLNQQLSKCEQDILKACDVLLKMYREVNALSKAYSRQALPIYHGMSEALLDSRKQVIQDGLHDINCVVSDNATESMLPASSSDGKGSSEILSNKTTSFTLSASMMSLASATSCTLQASATSFTVTAAATSFTLLVSNSHNEKLETKQLKRKWEQIASHKGERGHNVSQPRSPMLFRHKHIKRRDKTQYILPDVCVAYSSRAVTYLSEVGLSDGYCNLPLARRRKFCQHAKS